MPTTYYSEEEYEQVSFVKDVMSQVINNFLRNYEKKFRDEHKPIMEKNDQWHYIPNYNTTTFIKTLKTLYEEYLTKNPVFLELGAGLGMHTRIARYIGYKATGIELMPDLVALGKEIFQDKILCQDIMKSSKEISEADVIYFYSPFKGTSLKGIKFIDFVIKNMRNGAYLIPQTHTDIENKHLLDFVKKGVLQTNYQLQVFQKNKRALTLHINIVKDNVRKQRETLKQELQTLTKNLPRAKNLPMSIEDEEVREIMAGVF